MHLKVNDTPGAARASRRAVLAGGATLAGVLASRRDAAAQEAAAQADFLFVQTAQTMAFDADQNRLTLRGVSPVTLFFSDRPERIAGNMATAAFLPFWSQGSDSFLSDPPNADLSVIEDGTLRQTVVVLRDPVLGKAASVFIDIIGMPLTPLSYAGVARRGFRRAALY